jgi:hypothetical protein
LKHTPAEQEARKQTPAKGHLTVYKDKQPFKQFEKTVHIYLINGDISNGGAFSGKSNDALFSIAFPDSLQDGTYTKNYYKDFSEPHIVTGYSDFTDSKNDFEAKTGTLQVTFSDSMKHAAGTFEFTSHKGHTVTGDFEMQWS